MKISLFLLACLIQSGSALAQQDIDLELFSAAANSNEQAVSELLAAGANPNTFHCKGVKYCPYPSTALFESIINGSYNIPLLLIKYGADVNLRDKVGRNSLFVAMEEGHAAFATVELLFNNGVEVNVMVEPSLETPLHRLIFSQTFFPEQKLKILKWMVKKGVDLEARARWEGNTALMFAASLGQLSIMQALIKAGADLEARSRYLGHTALFHAIWDSKAGDPQAAVELLLRSGAEVNALNDRGMSALQFAVGYGYVGTAWILLEIGKADPNIQDKDGRSPLMDAVWVKNTPLVEMLLKYKASVELKNSADETALMYNSYFGKVETMKLLVAAGARLDHVNRFGKTALDIAEEYGNTEVYEYLVSLGAP